MDDHLPLRGLRVADFSWYAAGPIAARTLASYGAEVIRVESEAHLDGLRLGQPLAPGKTGPNVSGYYNNYNCDKRSFTLNMGQPGARAVALDLLARCDVMLENYTPRVMERWGLTYDDVARVRPDIIYLREPMQGLSGPHRDFLGFGGIIGPTAGFSYPVGWPDRDPTGLGTNFPDYVINCGHAAIAILAALRYRRRTGRGQMIELSQVESTANALGPLLLDYTVNGRVSERHGNRSPSACPHGAFPAAGDDRWLALAVYHDVQWQGLLDVLGRPSWGDEPRFATFRARKAHEDELEALLGGWTKTLPAEEAMRLLQAKGVPAGVVQTAEDVLDHDPHLRERGYYVYLDHPETGRAAYDGLAFRLGDTPGRIVEPAPLLGQHNDYVLRDLLGYDDERIAHLITEQIVF